MTDTTPATEAYPDVVNRWFEEGYEAGHLSTVSLTDALRAAGWSIVRTDALKEAADPVRIHECLMADPLLPNCTGTHAMGYGACQRISVIIASVL